MTVKPTRLRKALASAGLEQYYDVLEEAEVTDAKTMASLTQEDWDEIVLNEQDRERFEAVMARLKQRKKAKPRPEWRHGGTNTNNFGTRSPFMNPTMDAMQMERRRALLRKAQEVAQNPSSTKDRRDWAAATSADCGTTKVNLTGTKWHLKPRDTVRVVCEPNKLHRAIGSINAKKFPKAVLSCGKVGEVVELNEAVHVKLFPDDNIAILPQEALELKATRLLSTTECDSLLETKGAPPPFSPGSTMSGSPSPMRDAFGTPTTAKSGTTFGMSPETSAAKTPTFSTPQSARGFDSPARWGREGSGWQTPQKRGEENARHPVPAFGTPQSGVREVPQWGATTPQSAKKTPVHAFGSEERTPRSVSKTAKSQRGRVVELEAEVVQLKRELAEQKALHAGGAQHQSVEKDDLQNLLAMFTTVSDTLAVSASLWASQLSDANPSDAAMRQVSQELNDASAILGERLAHLTEKLGG